MRMPFVKISAHDVFQRRLEETFERLNGFTFIIDDIWVFWGAKEEHDG
jgi:hypothetical protein